MNKTPQPVPDGDWNCKIESLGVYLPENSVTTTEILKGCCRTIAFPIETVTGIHSRRIAAPGEYAIDLARAAIGECLMLSRHQLSDIDLVIACNISRYDAEDRVTFEPGTALRLCHDLGIQPALALDVSNACAGLFTAILLADTMIRAGRAARALLVSGEQISHVMRTAQRELKGFLDPRLACLTLGDAGVALILERGHDNTSGLAFIEMQTIAKFGDACIAKASERPLGGAIMLTKAVRLANAGVEMATRHAVRMQRSTGWPVERIDHLIPHQTSDRTIREAGAQINLYYDRNAIPQDKVISNVAERGNTASTSHFVAFNDHALSGRIQPGDNVVFSVSASGLTVGTGLYICDDLPSRLRARTSGRLPAATSIPPKGAPHKVWRPPVRTNQARIASIGMLPAGPRRRRDTMTLATEAAQACLTAWGGDPRQVDAMIFTGVYRTEFLSEPAICALVAGELALNHEGSDDPAAPSTICFDLAAGAGGMLMACQIAACAISQGRFRRVLVMTSEVENNADHPARPLLGIEQTGAALLLEAAQDEAGFAAFLFGHNLERIDTFGTACDLTVPGGALIIHRGSHDAEWLASLVAKTAHGLLEQTCVAPSSIQAVIAPQIDAHHLAAISVALQKRIPELVAPVIDAQDARNDLYDCFLPACLDQACRSGAIVSGDMLLILSHAAGDQTGAALYRV